MTLAATGTILPGDYLKPGINKLKVQRKTNGWSANTDTMLKGAACEMQYFSGKTNLADLQLKLQRKEIKYFFRCFAISPQADL